MKAVAALTAVLVIALTAGCGSGGSVKASGSTAYFFAELDQADASADYFTLPVSLADTLPNRTYRSRTGVYRNPVTFSWSKRFVVGRVSSVHRTDHGRIRLRIHVEESFPAGNRPSVDVLVAGVARDEDRYLASAASLKRVVIGIDQYRDDDGRVLTVGAMSSQLIGMVGHDGRIRWPVLARDDFASAAWDRDMTTLSGLRRQAAAARSTVPFGVIYG